MFNFGKGAVQVGSNFWQSKENQFMRLISGMRVIWMNIPKKVFVIDVQIM